jgi:hypothetical protein
MTNKNDKPNRAAVGSSQLSTRENIGIGLAKAGAELAGAPGVGTFLDIAVGLVQGFMAKTEETMRTQREERLHAFYEKLLRSDAAMDEQVAKAMIDDRDFHALLRACVMEIEEEKVGVYATLARGIAAGNVHVSWRRHFVLALKDLSIGELQCLRMAYVANSHNVVGQGNSSRKQTELLGKGPAGSLQSIQMNNLSMRGFVDAGELTELGNRFTKACWAEEKLTAKSLDWSEWSFDRFLILCYDLDDIALADRAMSLEAELHRRRCRANVRAVLGSDGKDAPLRYNRAILLVLKEPQRILQQAPALVDITSRIPTVAVTSDHTFMSALPFTLAGTVEAAEKASETVARVMSVLKTLRTETNASS